MSMEHWWNDWQSITWRTAPVAPALQRIVTMLYRNRLYWCLGYIPSSEVKNGRCLHLSSGQRTATAYGGWPFRKTKSVFVIFTELQKIMIISRQRNPDRCPNPFQLQLIKNCDSEITKILAKSREDWPWLMFKILKLAMLFHLSKFRVLFTSYELAV